MRSSDCRKLAKAILGNVIVRSECIGENLYFNINSDAVLESVKSLSSNAATLFSTLTDCFAVDFLKQKERFSIFYQLHSYKIARSIFIMTDIRKDEKMQSVTTVFENANWYEREIFDMFGIEFHDHPDMRRILTLNSEGMFPLRKISNIS
ncbi:MAG: NADH-quinone oxidoreductase subunit C [Holosporales bacterium]|jgi:NADH-quinone oxidoreductase subunit C|nr:NADH-quinone oxidoreductase subunit C [Holosporales bacterium]